MREKVKQGRPGGLLHYVAGVVVVRDPTMAFHTSARTISSCTKNNETQSKPEPFHAQTRPVQYTHSRYYFDSTGDVDLVTDFEPLDKTSSLLLESFVKTSCLHA